MKTLNGYYFGSILALFALVGCDKSNEGVLKSTEMEATIFYQGDPALDGCGWAIKIDEDFLHPLNLPAEYRVDGLNVKVNYKPLGTLSTCGWRVPGNQNVEIIQIGKVKIWQ